MIFPPLSHLLCLLKSLWQGLHQKPYQNPYRQYQPNHVAYVFVNPYGDLQTKRFTEAFKEATQILPQQILSVQASTHSVLY